MKTLRFEGYSDDTFGEYAVTRKDHDNCANGEPIVWRARAGGEELLVVGWYAPAKFVSSRVAGAWMIGVVASAGPSGEVESLPAWPMRLGQSTETPYSASLCIDVPDDVTIALIGDDEDEDEDGGAQ